LRQQSDATDATDAIDALAAGDAARALTFPLVQHWLPGSPPLTLHARVTRDGDGVVACIDDAPLPEGMPLAAAAAHVRRPLLRLDEPVRLEACRVDKPWGHELWFTGSERRGLSLAGDGTHALPLAWLLALAPRRLGACATDVVLLKLLVPHAESPYGDLYFELHEQKREVYVVTGIDARAWPGGVGAVRLGMNQRLRRRLGDAAFRAAYRDAVAEYRGARDAVDRALDALRARDGVAADAIVAPARTERWLAEVPAALRTREERLRAACEAFTHCRPLHVGDVVAIAPGQPHALQHGVTVVEFQTATYERRILSFAQKVLTQPHWDTAEAIAALSLEPVPEPAVESLLETPDARVERVAAFPDFDVQRVRLAAGAAHAPPAAAYRLCGTITGRASAGGLALPAGAFCFVPRAATARPLLNTGDDDAVLLLATPRAGTLPAVAAAPPPRRPPARRRRH
jgi:hypothetical protein